MKNVSLIRLGVSVNGFFRKLLKTELSLLFTTFILPASKVCKAVLTGKGKRLFNFFIVLAFQHQNFSVYCSIGKFLSSPFCRCHSALISVRSWHRKKKILLGISPYLPHFHSKHLWNSIAFLDNSSSWNFFLVSHWNYKKAWGGDKEELGWRLVGSGVGLPLEKMRNVDVSFQAFSTSDTSKSRINDKMLECRRHKRLAYIIERLNWHLTRCFL